MELALGAFLFLAGLVARSYLPGYFAEKGKNLATKEDIGAITREVEKVRSEYAEVAQRLKTLSDLRLAALERRLDAHQQAFFLWRKLISTVHSPNLPPSVRECQEWWERNCLYLSAEARQAFSDAYFAAMAHAEILKSRDVELVKTNWAKITVAGEVIVASVQLPPIAGGESVAVTVEEPSPNRAMERTGHG